MKASLPIKLATITTVFLSTLTPLNLSSAQAQTTFSEQDMDQSQIIAIARPYSGNKYDLLVIEQIPGKKSCWSESGANPVVVDPLLSKFDWTGICRRSTDSNGYSIRLDGQDYGSDYLLSVVERNGELLLLGIPRGAGNKTELIVGRTNGIQPGAFQKFILNPGWKFTRRMYKEKPLGHYYFSGNLVAITGGTPTPTTPSTSGFTDISKDIYQTEIEQAATLGLIAKGTTFNPTTPLTREQLVSIVVEALKTVPNVKVEVPPQVSTSPFPDVSSSRWSASKIQWAANNKIVKGYADGSFKPTKEVTRAELITVLKNAAEYAKTQGGKSATLTPTQAPKTFSDTSQHWAKDTISQMSAYCGAASPYNEQGNAFIPDQSALRNYAAAATLRTFNCVKNDK